MRFRDAQGRRSEAYYIGELAARLGKSSHTIRRWEREGVLPATPFEQRVRRRPARRLYPTAWIDGVVALAEDEDLIGRKPSCLERTGFTTRAQELHRRLFGCPLPPGRGVWSAQAAVGQCADALGPGAERARP